MRQRFRGALLGLAAGDAVGTTLEFKPPGTFEPITDMVGGGPFGLPAGAWTDDTSMAMCLAESLVECGEFDAADQLERYRRWYRDGYWSSTGACFDIGNATRAAIERFERTGEEYPGDAAPNAAGNGPLMKLAPVPLAYAGDKDAARRFAALSARTTHGDPRAADACEHFASLLVETVTGAPKGRLAAPREEDRLHPEVAAIAAGSFLTNSPEGTGLVTKALEAALWAFATTDDYRSGALAAANLGDDADTTAAIYGQLAGAHYGVDGIPPEWREKIVRRDGIVALADRLHDLAVALAGGGW